ncbi:MAG: hypothetical protein ABW212_03425 [Pseudonocardia sediminis]
MTIAPVTSTRDRVGRILYALLSASTVAAFANGVVEASAAGSDTLFMQWWVTTAYLVFAWGFAMLALRPRSTPGLWEVVLLQKAAVTVIGFSNVDADGAVLKASVDLGLIVTMAVAWVLCRGWLSWTKESAAVVPASPYAVAAG